MREPQPVGAKAPRFFYGWLVIGVLSLTSAVGMGMGGLNFGLFIKPMGDDLGIPRAIFGWAQTARQLAGAVTSPVTGRLIDRFGVRVILPVTIAVVAVVMVGLSTLTEGWQLIVLFGVIGVVGLVGPGSLVMTVPVAKWFVRRRGRAMAITIQGAAVGGMVFVPLTQLLINQVGWRLAWSIVAGICALLVIPIAIVILRRQPEDLGLLPDGDAASAPHVPGSGPRVLAAHEAEVSWTAEEVRRTPTFWRLVFVFSVVMLGQSTFGLHRIPGFMDRGLDPTLVSFATAIEPGVAGLSMFAFGYLAERFQLRYIGAAGILLVGVAIFITLYAYDAPMMFISMAVFGMGAGSGLLLQNHIWAQYYGRKHVGAIRGLVQPITLFCSGVGPPVAGYVRDATGSYDGVWWAALVLVLIGAVAFATAPDPNSLSQQRVAAADAPV